MKSSKKMAFSFILLIVVFGFSFFSSGFLGSVNVKLSSVLDIFQNKIFGRDISDIDKGIQYIVWELRVPRALLAIVVGGGLAVSGISMQAITQNILAEPYMLGVSSGALVGVTLVNYFQRDMAMHGGITSIAAFIGASVALFSVYKVGKAGKDASSGRLILAGLAISIILNAFSNFLIITMPDSNAIRNILSWTMGTLSAARWENIWTPIFGICLPSLYFFFHARNYDMISLGGETALSLGVNASKLKKHSIIAVSIITAFCVSSAGLIGLVGFIIPHILRMIFGPEHRKLFPLSFVVGALFLIWMDILARSIIAPRELPIGIFTAFCGGPIFVWVLLKKKK